MNNEELFKDYVFTDNDYNIINKLVDGEVDSVIINGIKLILVKHPLLSCENCVLNKSICCNHTNHGCEVIQAVGTTKSTSVLIKIFDEIVNLKGLTEEYRNKEIDNALSRIAILITTFAKNASKK